MFKGGKFTYAFAGFVSWQITHSRPVSDGGPSDVVLWGEQTLSLRSLSSVLLYHQPSPRLHPEVMPSSAGFDVEFQAQILAAGYDLEYDDGKTDDSVWCRQADHDFKAVSKRVE